MKLIITGDWHLRYGNPGARIDNYEEAQYEKVRWIFELARSQGCNLIIQPGDLTEYYPYPRMNFETVAKYLSLIKGYRELSVCLLSIRGQHDMPHHSELKNTPYSVFVAANALDVLTESPDVWELNLAFYGCSFGEEIPKPRYLKTDKVFNVLVIHRMISNQDYWDGHVQYASVEWLADRTREYNLVVCGDNHHEFHATFSDDRPIIFNCGSLMRSNIDQVNHRPCVWVFDTDEKTMVRHYVPITRYDEVFNLKEVKKEEERRIENDVYISHLEKGLGDVDVDFVRTLNSMMPTEDPEVDSIITEALTKKRK